MHDRPRIRARHADGHSVRDIAADLGASRGAVRRALVPGARDSYRRFEPAIRDVLATDPRATVARVGEQIAWPGSRRRLAELVAQLRPAALERERAGLQRPAMGTMRVGTMRVGQMKAGPVDGGDARSGGAR